MDKSQFTPRTILADNLNALMKTRDGPHSENDLAAKSKVAQATIGRIRAKTSDAKIDTVDKLARAYGLEGWQLLVAGMDPSNPPVLQPVSKAERALYDRLKSAVEDIGKLKS